METRDIIATASVIVAILAMFSVACFAWLNYQRERLNQRIQYANLKQQYFAALRAWSDQLSDLLSDAIHFSELDPSKCEPGSFFKRRNEIRVNLSSHIDKGRWFFSNLNTEEFGQHKEKAFRGYRQDVLNSLVASYDAVTKLNYLTQDGNDQRRQELVDAKKKFVSEIQDVLNPTKRDEEFQHITNVVIGRALQKIGEQGGASERR